MEELRSIVATRVHHEVFWMKTKKMIGRYLGFEKIYKKGRFLVEGNYHFIKYLTVSPPVDTKYFK